MTADILRRAAVRAQELADGATWPDVPWAVDEIGGVWTRDANGRPVSISSQSSDEDAELIAACDPAFLRKASRLLNAIADRVENRPLFAQTPIGAEAADLARALLGESEEAEAPDPDAEPHVTVDRPLTDEEWQQTIHAAAQREIREMARIKRAGTDSSQPTTNSGETP